MCGRFTLTKSMDEIRERFDFVTDLAELDLRYNIAPTQYTPVIVYQDGVNVLKKMRWGLIPSWAKEERIGYRMINARAEEIDRKPTFRPLLPRRRCLVLADGFYEWEKRGQGKGRVRIPYRFTLKDESPFAFAGLWDKWRSPEGEELETLTIITTRANKLVSAVHNRMPVILRPEDINRWVDTSYRNVRELKNLLTPYPSEEMKMYRVSTRVNSPDFDSPECVEKVEDQVST